MNVIYLSFICQGELALQAAVCAAWLLILLFLASAARWAPRRWDPFAVQGGGVFLLVSVRETTIFRGAEEGWAWPSWAGGRGRRVKPRWLAPAVPRSGVKKFQ